MESLTKAKAALILDNPFFASILFSMPIVQDESVKTLATNGEEIRYNRQFLEGLTHGETVFALAHETLHCVFNHMYRRGNRDHARWNQAADYVINDLLKKERVGTVIKGALLDSALVQAGNGTAEGVYSLLPEVPPENQPQPGESGGSLDDCEDGAGDEAERAEKEAEMKVKVIQAANAAKMAGKLSQGLARLVSEIAKPKIDWREVLRRFLSEKAKDGLSFAKPNRRFLADDMILPSLNGEKAGGFVIAVDCSGSIDEKTISAFAAEIRSILEDTRPQSVYVIYFDSKVTHVDSFQADESPEIKAHGGGGTAFSPVFREIEARNLEPSACVFLTDLCCSDFGPAPGYPVLWASTHEGTAPFGEIVRMM